MPHIFVNRPRLYGVHVSPEDVLGQFKWEAINAVFYVVGGILLTIGSVLFLPQYDAIQYIGAWIFIVASVLYITVSGHDLIEIISGGKPDWKELVAATSYVIGAGCFIAGSSFFLPHVELYTAGAWNFIIGSFLFVVGAVVNSIQLFASPTRKTAFLANLVAVSFVVGSTLYLSASVPYLSAFDTDRDLEKTYQYLAMLYIAGSLLFTLGGVLNIYRAKLIMERELARERSQAFLTHQSTGEATPSGKD